MVTINYLSGKAFEVKVRDHVLICDQPLKSDGQDRGPAPAEFFGASLGACIGYYAMSYLEARSLPTEGLQVHTSWEGTDKPKRIASIKTRIVLPDGVPEVNHDRILRACQRCLIHNTLHEPPEVSVEIDTGDVETTTTHE